MKKLSLEEKAKAYDEAIERAKKLHETCDSQAVVGWCEYIFPEELTESEDERIRKELLAWLKSTDGQTLPIDKYNAAIAWLEKQGESDETKAKMFLISKGYPIDANGNFPTFEEMYNIIKDGVEKQSEQETLCDKCKKAQPSHSCQDITALGRCAVEHEQKPADKIEPKFKVGDFIKHNKANIICKVISVNSGSYYVENIETRGRIELFNAEQNFHLWSIQEDAKDGDVLHCWIDGEEFVLIYKGIKDGYFTTYGHLYQKFKLFAEEPTTMFCRTIQGHFTPATKEQRDLLFQKMHEAGYEWDVEKKELKKIEQNPAAWGEEDEKTWKELIEEVKDQLAYVPAPDCRDEEDEKVLKQLNKWLTWLKSLKDRVQPKQEWSEKDVRNIQDIDSVLFYDKNLPEDTCVRLRKWLKHLKDRVQPQPKQEWSEEDKKKLNLALYFLNESKQNAPEEFETYGKQLSKKDYEDVVNWLKSLKPQNRWKPSDEQLETLANALSLAKNCGEENAFDLRTLYEQLKKLKEE